MHEEILEKKPILVQLEKRNLELKHENRELMAQLLDGKQHIESSVRQCQHSKVIQRTERKLGEMVVQVNMMQHIFQCLILGSAVDWGSDQRLCQLMISLGKPLDMQLCLHDPATLTDVSTHDS
ncbi:hypothetical protein NP493_1628g00015 [Ridgeia piscesae]|uniref:Centromere protein H C-terminal domain-containing protein n=1 Tax=Ridgeia piscesae TaxID=27915 RepID=A0AAD9NA69_RIDPI|nr:hypothetical protein NP493_1628g00015 [Ridgeia piscesae]